MLGFNAKCPLPLRERVWIETKFAWLIENLGKETMLGGALLMPDSSDFPEFKDLTKESIRPLFEQLIYFLRIEQEVELRILSNDEAQDDAVLFEKTNYGGIITVPESAVSNGTRLISSLSRDFSRIILVDEGFLTGDETDLEPIVDLTTVFYGLGLFGANACLQEQYEDNVVYFQWSMKRERALSSQEFGYALSLYCWLRNESPGDWVNGLRLDARETFVRGLKFLRKSDTHLILERRPASIDLPGYWEQRLTSRSDALKLNALWEMSEYGKPLPQFLVPCIREQLLHLENCIVLAALELLTLQTEIAIEITPEIFDCVAHNSSSISLKALDVLGSIPRSERAQEVIYDILFRSRSHELRVRAVELLLEESAPDKAEKTVDYILVDLRIAMTNQAEEVAGVLLSFLNQITDDTEQIITERFLHTEDDEWHRELLEILEVVQAEKTVD
ncbi:hypothetical protein OAF98_02300 [Planctomicrobium sp.]|jgi:hypothetical protein|nr:hypothetical protein [Planctomicrobium sp.]MBT5018297.1 hypothetical protein [Planctomicrobium sp.]MDA7503594.1 hypothetical protein [bacterium]MDB4743292.1 hypothetical protein [Planctomicrobium sp.]